VNGNATAGNWLSALLLLVAVVAVVAGNILLKLGATRDQQATIVDIMLNWRVITGLGLFAIAVVLYISTLRMLPLQVAQSFMVMQYAGVILASYAILGEHISAMRLLGIILIGGGVAVVSWT
jgi:multidrug transporter EmrE-like cation transporter